MISLSNQMVSSPHKCPIRLERVLSCNDVTSCESMLTVKPALSDHSKIDKTNVLKLGDSLIQVESIAE